MAFLHPILFAAGLSAVAIPILIHLLLRRKRRPVRWAAMRFLLEAHKRRQRRRKLEQILLLLARCLLVVLLAAAVARPMFGGDSQSVSSTLVLVIDNSLTASLINEDGRPAIEHHKQRAIEQLERLSASRGDRVAVITASAPASNLISPATLDLDSARRHIDSIRVTDSAADFRGALSLAGGTIPQDAPSSRVVLLSEWRRGSGLGDSAGPKSDAQFNIAGLEIALSPPAEDDPPNLRLTSLVPGREAVFPGDTPSASQALITIEREGETLPAINTTIIVETLGVSDARQHRDEQQITLPRGERVVSAPVMLPLPDGEDTDIAIRVSIRSLEANDTVDRIAGDGVALHTIRLRQAVRVGIIHARRANKPLGRYDAADWARVALRPDPLTPVEIRELNAAGLSGADLAGLDAALLTRPDLLSGDAWNAVGRFVARGATLVVFPPVGQVVHRWTDGLRTALDIETEFSREAATIDPPAMLIPGELASAFPMLSGDFDPLSRTVTVSYLLDIDTLAARVALRTEAGRPVLFSPIRRVWVFACALDTAWTDLPAKPLLVPLLQEIARQSAAPSRPTTVVAGIPPRVLPSAIEIVESGTGRRLARSPESGTIPAPRDAGVWTQRNQRGEPLGLIAVTPDHNAGRTGPVPADVVLEWVRQAVPGVEPTLLDPGGETSQAGDQTPSDSGDWIPFLIAAGLALVELVAARIASHAGGPKAGAGAGAGPESASS